MKKRKSMPLWLRFVLLGLVFGFAIYVIFSVSTAMDEEARRNKGFQPMPFNAAVWLATPAEQSVQSVRLRMVDDFLIVHPPVGMTRQQIVALIGEPDYKGQWHVGDMVYHLGLERSGMAIDTEWLALRVDAQGKVTHASIVTD